MDWNTDKNLYSSFVAAITGCYDFRQTCAHNMSLAEQSKTLTARSSFCNTGQTRMPYIITRDTKPYTRPIRRVFVKSWATSTRLRQPERDISCM